MNKIFDERKISTFRDFKELVRSNKLIGRREICIVVDRLELENVVYKAEQFDDIRKENKKLKDELYKYEIQNSELQKELVELRVNTGRNVILGDTATPKGFKSHEDYKKKEEAFINHFCKGDKENEKER